MAQAPLSSFEPMIPQVAELLADDDQLTAFFNSLTVGYQREWARYVFGAKAATTKQRHIDDMRLILAAGYKSKRAYGSRPNK
ncbi:YdeI/OmpD-associated family protein [Levilactobacillus yonginensis]|uniref:YdeI/OmpD-associated family protein n=1 Tax=Levilactobacillus yonginensis TaxID=1054041 RepID=UPI00345CC998